MSFDQLMQHAHDIKEKAIEREIIDQSQAAGKAAPYVVKPNEIRANYEGKVSPLFEPFSRVPDPASYDPLVNNIHSAMTSLSSGKATNPLNGRTMMANPNLDQMETAGGVLEDWTGLAADAFTENFLDPFDSYTKNQFILASALKGALEAHKAIWDHTRQDIDTIAHNTMNALENAGGCGKNDWKFGLSVLAAIGSVGAVFVTAGGAAPVSFAVIGAVASTGNAVAAGTEVAGGGGSAQAITQSMTTAIEQLEKEVEDAEHEIADGIGKLTNLVNQHQGDNLLVAPRPKLASMPDSELTGDAGVGTTT